jgi:ribosomal protein L32E
MNNDKYCVEIGKNVGSVLRTQMLKRAKELNIPVTNQKSKKIERLADKLKKKTN